MCRHQYAVHFSIDLNTHTIYVELYYINREISLQLKLEGAEWHLKREREKYIYMNI